MQARPQPAPGSPAALSAPCRDGANASQCSGHQKDPDFAPVRVTQEGGSSPGVLAGHPPAEPGLSPVLRCWHPLVGTKGTFPPGGDISPVCRWVRSCRHCQPAVLQSGSWGPEPPTAGTGRAGHATGGLAAWPNRLSLMEQDKGFVLLFTLQPCPAVLAAAAVSRQRAQRSHTTAQRWSFSSFVSSR